MQNKTVDDLSHYLSLIYKERDLEYHKMTAKNLVRSIRLSVAEELKEVLDEKSSINAYGVYLWLKDDNLEQKNKE